MFCSNCGQQVSDSVAFCGNCGQRIQGTASSASTSQAPVPPVMPAQPPMQTVQQPVQTMQPPMKQAAYPGWQAPALQLKTNRSLAKFFFLSLITFGIYGIVVMSSVSTDINVIASRYDGKKTMHFCLLFFLVSGLTLGIGSLVWYHRISARIGNALRQRNIAYDFGASDFWLWDILGSIIIVGPFIYMHKMLTAMNLLSASYNMAGC